MRLLIATGLYPPEIGGPATYTKLLEERLPAHGIEVSVLPFTAFRRLPIGVRHIAYAWKLARMARSADCMLVQDTVSTGFPAAIATFFTEKKLIVRVPGDYAWEQGVQRYGVKESLDEFQKHSYGMRVGLLRIIQRLVIHRATRVIAPSHYLAGVISGWTSHPEKIEVIYNGIEMPIAVEAPTQKPAGFTIVSLGRLVPWKGMEGIVRVIAQEKSWNVVIVGDGPQRKELEHLAQELSCSDRVKLLGQLPRAQALGWVKAADAFVLNSIYEGLSHQLIEAMSLGVPIAATTIDANTEVASDIAWPVQAGSDESLHKALKELESNPEKADQLRIRGVERAKDLSIDKTVKTTAKLLLNIHSSTRVLQISADRSKRGVLYPGSPTFTRQEAYAHRLGGLDIIGFSRKSDGAKEVNAGTLHVYPTNSVSSLLYGLDALEIARGLPAPSVVSAQDPFETGLLAWLISWMKSAPLHVQIHTDFLSPAYARLSLKNRVRTWIAGFVLRRAARIRVVSERIKKSIESRYRLRAPVAVLPIFVDIETFKNAQPVSRDEFLSRYQHKLLVVSRNTPEKNIQLAVSAFKQVAPEDACLTIIQDDNHPKNLQNRDGRIQFINTMDVSRYYKSVDLVLVPSFYEGYGLVIVEALAAGKPVLSTDVGVAREAGAIVTTPEKFADALAEWFKDGPHEGHLKRYPYKNFDEYVASYCDDIKACVEPKNKDNSSL